MEQPPVRIFVAGLVIAALAVFTTSFSYGRAQGLRREAAPAAAAVGDQSGVGGDKPGGAATAGKGEAAGGSAATGAGGSAGLGPASGSAPGGAPGPTGGGGATPADATGGGGATAGVRSIDATPAGGTSTIHTVREGESLSRIAQLYRVSVASLRSANGLKSDLIWVGQRLTVPGARRHEVVEGESLWELSSRYAVSLEELLAANSEVDPGHLQIGAELIIPASGGGAAAGRGTSASSGRSGNEPAAASLAGEFTWPVLAPISSHFGPRGDRNHQGLDLAANHGDPIRAARGGTVLLAGVVQGYGNTVVLEHEDGTRTLYGHASELKVKAGQKVRQGDLIALVGSTGRSTGPHLHFEIIVNDRPRDPLLYLPKR